MKERKREDTGSVRAQGTEITSEDQLSNTWTWVLGYNATLWV